jgi:hypothetical protein
MNILATEKLIIISEYIVLACACPHSVQYKAACYVLQTWSSALVSRVFTFLSIRFNLCFLTTWQRNSPQQLNGKHTGV